MMPTLLPTFPPILERLRAVVPAEIAVYVVGGTVRDALRHRSVHDIDLAAPGDTLTLARRIADALGGTFYPLDAARGTGRVILQGTAEQRIIIDIAAYRGNSLEDDLRARDFTINALAVPLHAPRHLIDPTGGLQDLKNKRLRACGPTAFVDDPVRILRGARLATELGFRIVPDTLALMRQAVPLLEDVSPERLRDELFRMLSSNHPTAALKALDALGALLYLLPEIPRLHGQPLPPSHTTDAWAHVMHTAEHLSALFAALAPHYEQENAADFALGYAVVRVGRYRHHLAAHLRHHGVSDRPAHALLTLAVFFQHLDPPENAEATTAARVAVQRARALRLSKDEIRRLSTIVRYHRLPWHLTQGVHPPSRRAIYRFFRATGDAGVEVTLLSLAAVLATYRLSLPHDLWQHHVETARTLLAAWWEQRDVIVSPPPLLSGHDMITQLHLPSGPIIGRLLEALREAQAAGEVTTREEALAFAQRWKAG